MNVYTPTNTHTSHTTGSLALYYDEQPLSIFNKGNAYSASRKNAAWKYQRTPISAVDYYRIAAPYDKIDLRNAPERRKKMKHNFFRRRNKIVRRSYGNASTITSPSDGTEQLKNLKNARHVRATARRERGEVEKEIRLHKDPKQIKTYCPTARGYVRLSPVGDSKEISISESIAGWSDFRVLAYIGGNPR